MSIPITKIKLVVNKFGDLSKCSVFIDDKLRGCSNASIDLNSPIPTVSLTFPIDGNVCDFEVETNKENEPDQLIKATAETKNEK